MRKISFLISLCIIGIVGKVNAQSDNLVLPSEMKREKFRLAIVESNGLGNEFKQTILKKDQLQLLLFEKQFSTYKHARRCFHASIPLLSLAACGVATTTYYGVLLIDSKFHPDKYRFPNGTPHLVGLPVFIFSVATLPFLISGTTLIVYSTKKLNRIAENYNRQHYSSFYQSTTQINFGITPNGIGMKLNF